MYKKVTISVLMMATAMLFSLEAQTQKTTERVRLTHRFVDVTVREIERITVPNVAIMAYRIEVLAKDDKAEVLWQITPDGLPVEEKDCFEADVALCGQHKDSYFKSICYNKCVAFGPEFLAFDKLAKNIYFYARLGIGGTAGFSCLIFAGDLHTKTIRRLASSWGPILHSLLSPSGQWLALGRAGPDVEIVETKSGKTVRNIDTRELSGRTAKGSEGRLRLRPERWVGDDQILIIQEEFTDKFSHEAIGSTEKTIRIK